MAKLGEKDYRILKFIETQLNTRGFPPSVREIGDEVGLSSPATVHARLKKLEQHGLISREGAKNRSIKLVSDRENAQAFVNVQVYGKIAAGIPITAVENIGESFAVPQSLAKGGELFMLRVSGESMINASILDGDLIIVRKQPTADNGDIVVALIGGEDATVKTLKRENGHIMLIPENDTMSPIIADDAEILGKVVGLFRTM